MTTVLAQRTSLLTLDALAEFLEKNLSIFPYAARYSDQRHEPIPYCWIFGSSKADVVDLALNWSKSVRCAWRPADKEERSMAGQDDTATYGFWELSNLPLGIPYHEWFNRPFELTDPSLSTTEVKNIFRERTFDDWFLGSGQPVIFFDSDGIAEELDYWQNERANGGDYYGSENELA